MRLQLQHGIWIAAAIPWLLLTPCEPAWARECYALSFSTYLGGSKWDYARDVCADAQSNIYMVGATASSDFPTTPGAYQRVQAKTGTHVGNYGYCDAFVTKFGPTGNLIWSTYLGGPNYDRAYAVEVDSQGYVYVAGRAGMGFPTTTNAFQPEFKGVDQGSYGWENAFVAKLSPDGSNLVWASYVGLGEMCRDMALDASGAICLPLVRNTGSFVPPGTNYTLSTAWFANAYQKTLKGGSEIGVIKVSSDGTRVLWATWLGGSSNENTATSIRADAAGCVYVFTETSSTDMPTTPGAWRQNRPGARDGYAAKLSADGSQLIYGTYVGGSGDDFVPSTHNLAVDAQGYAYLGGSYNSTDIPTTPGVVQPAHAGGKGDIAIIKLTPTGSLSRCTYFGGKGDEGSDGIYADSAGNVFISGSTSSTNFPITPGAVQTVYGGGTQDSFVVRLSADFSQILYSTYMGGSNWDTGTSGFLDQDYSLYLVGCADGSGWPIKNAYQTIFKGRATDPDYTYPGWAAGDVTLAKFIPSDPAVHASSISTTDTNVTLLLTNPTQTIPCTIWRTNQLSPTSDWTRARSITSSSPAIAWVEGTAGRTSAYYSGQSGL